MVNSLPAYGYQLPKLDEKRERKVERVREREGGGALDNLTDYITHVIFSVTADHELYGSPISYFNTPMGMTTKIFNETFEDNNLDENGQVMQDIQTFLQSLIVICGTGVPMPRLVAGWNKLMNIQKEDEGRWEGKLKLNLDQVAKFEKYLAVLWEAPSTGEYTGWRGDVLGYNGVKGNLPGYEREKRLSPEHAGKSAADYNTKRAVDCSATEYQDNLRSMAEQDIKAKLMKAQEDDFSVEDHNWLLWKLHSAFMEKLVRLSDKINGLNKTRKCKFEDYNPMNLESSVSI